MKSHWRRTLAIAPLLAVALLVCVSGSASAANVIGVEICSPTGSSPAKRVSPGSTITVMTRVTVDGAGRVRVSACTGGSGQYVEHQMAVAERVFSISVEVPNGIAEDGNSVEVIAQMLPDGNTRSASESNAVYVDGTPPVVTLGTPPTTPTTNPRPTWTWSSSDALSGLDYYIVTLDGELPFQTTGTSFTPSSDLAHGTHVLKIKAVDKAGNVGMEQSFSAVTISAAPPAAPAIATLAAGYNTSPIEID